KMDVQGLTDTLSATKNAGKGAAASMTDVATAGSEASRIFRQQNAALEQTGHQYQDFTIYAGAGTNAIAKTERQARETTQEVQRLGSSLGATAAASQLTAKNAGGMTTAGAEATRMFRLQKGALQQAGFQFQDLAVQIGGGTSAFVAIGQQGSQL